MRFLVLNKLASSQCSDEPAHLCYQARAFSSRSHRNSIHMLSSGAINTVCNIQIEGRRGPGGPRMTWKTLTETLVSGISTRSIFVIGMCEDPV